MGTVKENTCEATHDTKLPNQRCGQHLKNVEGKMSTKQIVDNLWNEMREAINRAYAIADKNRDADGTCLRDYAENISWSDSLAALLGRESANERQHRSNRPSVPGFSVDTASKLILM